MTAGEQGSTAGDLDLIERVAEAIHAVEYPAYSPTAVADHNRWSWRGDGTSEVVREVFREYARAAVAAMGRGDGRVT